MPVEEQASAKPRVLGRFIRGGKKWLGVLLALYLGFLLALLAFGVAMRIALVLLPFFLLALPLLVYDLLVRAPFEGRFQRARAERRHLRGR